MRDVDAVVYLCSVCREKKVCARALVGMTRSGPHDFQNICLRVRMLRLPLFDRLVMWIFCRGTIAVFAEKKKEKLLHSWVT